MRARSHGFRVPPKWGFWFVTPNAHSCMFVLPTVTAPAGRSRATTGASASGTRSARIRDPAVVRTPAVSKRSFSAIGAPASAADGDVARALASARSAVMVMKAWSRGSSRSMRARDARTTSSALVRRSLICPTTSSSESHARSVAAGAVTPSAYEAHAVADADAGPIERALAHLERHAIRLARVVHGAWIRGARLHVEHAQDPAVGGDERDREAQRRVLHPERARAVLRPDEEHARVLVEGGAAHEPAFARRVRLRDLDVDETRRLGRVDRQIGRRRRARRSARDDRERDSTGEAEEDHGPRPKTAVPTGFEPAISSLTGTYARPLHHGTGSRDARRVPAILPEARNKGTASVLPSARRPCRCGRSQYEAASSRRGAFAPS